MHIEPSACTRNRELVISVPGFHNWDFNGSAFQPGNLHAGVAVGESVFGIVIEGVFTAMLVERSFGGR